MVLTGKLQPTFTGSSHLLNTGLRARAPGPCCCSRALGERPGPVRQSAHAGCSEPAGPRHWVPTQRTAAYSTQGRGKDSVSLDI